MLYEFHSLLNNGIEGALETEANFASLMANLLAEKET
jgi:hypothetical protein